METLTIVCPHCHAVNTVINELKKSSAACASCGFGLHETKPAACSDETAKIHIQQNQIAVLIDFYSPDCAPCMKMAPEYESAARAFALEVRFLKVNTLEFQELARHYRVNHLPTVIAFKNGQEVNRFSSALSEQQLAMWAESLIQITI